MLGGALTLAGTVIVEYVTKAHRRKSTATALLIELRAVERALRSLYANETAATVTGYIPIPLHDSLRNELLVLRPSAVRATIDFWSSIQSIRTLFADVRDGRVKEDEANFFMRRLAGFALIKMNRARKELEREGGTVPPHSSSLPLSPGELPAVPDSVFDHDPPLRRPV
jgi:hypothetical protein